jgi:hypothetical protein
MFRFSDQSLFNFYFLADIFVSAFAKGFRQSPEFLNFKASDFPFLNTLFPT